MDSFLRYLLTKFIRRGTMTFSTADGETFTCGDGTGDKLLSRITRKSWDTLQLRVGSEVYAQIKGVALV